MIRGLASDPLWKRNGHLKSKRRTRIVLVALGLALIWLLFTGHRRLDRRHPVEILHARGEAEFKALLARQSRTPDAAEETYRSRYGRAPPPGFRQWAKYAIAARSPILDDYDIIDEAIVPFLSMNGSHILDLMTRASQLEGRWEDDEETALCTFDDGKFLEEHKCKRDWFGAIEQALGNAARFLPKMKVLINYLDEPSVLATTLNETDMHFTDMGHKYSGDLVRTACKITGPIKSSRKRPSPVPTYGIPFVQDLGDSKDTCLHPNLTEGHGFFLSPDSYKMLNVRVPILSTGKPHPMADLVIPSPQYLWSQNLFDPASDNSWSEKMPAVYWSGSTTGSHGTEEERSWKQSHRQRLVAMFDGRTHPGDEKRPPRTWTYLRQNWLTGGYSAFRETELDKRLFHVRLTTALQCEDEVCAAEEEYFGEMKQEPFDTPFGFKYLLDPDGNAYTNRFYRLLGADSCPLKMSLWREWHDDRLIPWLHFIPVSQGMEELPELMRFLATTPEGEAIGRRIATAGGEWYGRALTEVHQGVYIYRLLLELAWLQNPARVPHAPEGRQ